MAWRVVRSLIALRTQINVMCPGRKTGGDGSIGDAKHAESASDHNPARYAALGSTPVVCALDITHDPAHGCDSYAIAEAVRASRDPRCAYIISNHRIASNHAVGGHPAWAWRPYAGSGDPHTGHAHFSSVHTAVADNERPWAIRAGQTPTPQGANMPDVNLSWGETLSAYLSRIEKLWVPAVNAAAQHTALLAAIAKAQGVAQADLDDIQAHTSVVVLSDVQFEKLAAAVIGRPDNPLTDADTPVLVHAFKQAMREGSDA